MLRLVGAYPRVTIEAILTVAATVVGVLILPSLSSSPASTAAIQSIVLLRPSNVSTYLLYDAYQGGETVVVGMDTKTPVNWQMVVIYNTQDSLTDRSTSSGVSYVQSLSSSFLGTSSDYRGELIRGTAGAGSHSFSEFNNGYWQVFSEHFNAFSNSSGLPKDDNIVNFTLTGPVPVTSVAGANIAVALPALDHKDQVVAGQPVAPFNSEVFYDGGTYQNLTGGATIQGGTYWDWFNHGLFPGTVATGVDDITQQNEQNETFIAAAMFGLAAAGLAAFCVELVDVYEKRRHRRPDPAPVEPSVES